MVSRGNAEIARTFYRIIQSEVPTLRDFLSAQALAELAEGEGQRPRKPPTAPERLAVWSGVSVYDSEAGARDTALFYQRRLGGFIAQLRVAEGGPVTWKKTLGAGHYTLWGEPAVLVERVESVLPV